MKKSLLALAAGLALTAASADAAKVYFKNSDNWPTVKAYAWNKEGQNGATEEQKNDSWPGVTVDTQVQIGGETFYCYDTGDAKYANIIFNNGNGTQTADQTFYDDAIYTPSMNQVNTDPSQMVSDGQIVAFVKPVIPVEPSTTNRVYFLNTGNWNPVYAFAWGGDHGTGNYPGDVVETTVDIDGVTLYYFDTDCPNLIFSNGSGSVKTKDLVVKNDGVYTYAYNEVNSGKDTAPYTTNGTEILKDGAPVTLNPDGSYTYTGWYAYINNTQYLMKPETNGSYSFTGTIMGDLPLYFENTETHAKLYPTAAIDQSATYELSDSNGNFKINNINNWEFTLNLFPEEKELVVTGLANSTITSEWYLSFDNNGTDGWEFNRPMSKQEDGSYMSVVTFPTPADGKKNFLAVTDGIMNNWSVPGGHRYGPASETEVNENTPATKMVYSSDPCWILAEGTWTVVVYPDSYTGTDPNIPADIRPAISFEKGDIAIVDREPNNVWLIGAFNEFGIPDELNGVIVNANGADAFDKEADGTFVGYYTWTGNFEPTFGIVGTYSATRSSNYYGPATATTLTLEEGVAQTAPTVTVYPNPTDNPVWTLEGLAAGDVLKVTFTYDETNPTATFEKTGYTLPLGVTMMGSLGDVQINVPMTVDATATDVMLCEYKPTTMGTLKLYFVGKEGDGYQTKYGPASRTATPIEFTAPGIDGTTGTMPAIVINNPEKAYWYTEIDESSVGYNVPIYVAINVNAGLVAFSTETIATAVDQVTANDAEPIYFNLQGVRIANPTKGLYIRVKGTKAEKILF